MKSRVLGIVLVIAWFVTSGLAQPLDYSMEDYWAALPEMIDNADLVPGSQNISKQGKYDVDVFFLHPTSYNGNRVDEVWNAPIDHALVNQHTNDKSIKYQASLFNAVGRVYAPRYRQAHISSYFTKDTLRALAAFDVAFRDVADAFLYYLEHFNEGRPFIIASHSQGTNHAIRLIKEYIQGKPIQDKMIVAYLVGMPVFPNDIQLNPCETPDQTGCYCSWRTFLKDHVPNYIVNEPPIIVTNPITWTIHDEHFSDIASHKGAVLFNFGKKPKPGIVSAMVHENVLWINKPRVFGKMFYNRKNYHIGDYNLFYVDVQANALLRTEAYLRDANILSGNKK